MKIDFARPDREHEALREALEQAAARVLCSGRSILGDEVAQFEIGLARVVGSKFAVGVSSGTDALASALYALDIAEGDEVIVGAFGFVAAPEAVVRVGARPVFVDLAPEDLTLDPKEVARALSANTRAIISVDLFGLVHDLSPLRKAAQGARIVEDAAQAFGGALGEKQAGTSGDIGVFSFFPSKALGAAGDAGACVTDDEGLVERLIRIRSHGAGKTYAWEMRGGNYRLDAMQAAIRAVKLAHFPVRLERRRLVGERLMAAARRAGAVPLSGAPSCRPAFAPLALRIGGGRRNEFLARLREKGIDARVHYPSTLAACPPFVRYAGRRIFPEAERATHELVSLPCHPELTDEEIAYLEAAVAGALG